MAHICRIYCTRILGRRVFQGRTFTKNLRNDVDYLFFGPRVLLTNSKYCKSLFHNNFRHIPYCKNHPTQVAVFYVIKRAKIF